MKLSLSDDQAFFRETSRKFLASRCSLSTVRELRASESGFVPAYWRNGAELGWTSLLVPEELDAA